MSYYYPVSSLFNIQDALRNSMNWCLSNYLYGCILCRKLCCCGRVIITWGGVNNIYAIAVIFNHLHFLCDDLLVWAKTIQLFIMLWHLVDKREWQVLAMRANFLKNPLMIVIYIKGLFPAFPSHFSSSHSPSFSLPSLHS